MSNVTFPMSCSVLLQLQAMLPAGLKLSKKNADLILMQSYIFHLVRFNSGTLCQLWEKEERKEEGEGGEGVGQGDADEGGEEVGVGQVGAKQEHQGTPGSRILLTDRGGCGEGVRLQGERCV